MSSVNAVFLIGHLGQDPTIKHLDSGGAVCNFTIATNESWTDKAGVKQERTEWHRIVIFTARGTATGIGSR